MSDGESEAWGGGDVWATLSRVDVSDHVEQKGPMKLSYLSWAWAWAQLKTHYPNSTYKFTKFGKTSEWDEGTDVLTYEDGTCSVECTVTVEGIKHSMWLPVMDHRNNAISNPDARAINDTKMRALVKGIAMHGLGFSLFAGSDLDFLDEGTTVKKEAPRRKRTRKAKASKQNGEAPPQQDLSKNEEKATDQPEEIEKEDIDALVRTYRVFADGAKNVRELNKFWRQNVENLNEYRENYPDIYEEVLEVFRMRKLAIKENSNEADG